MHKVYIFDTSLADTSHWCLFTSLPVSWPQCLCRLTPS